MTSGIIHTLRVLLLVFFIDLPNFLMSKLTPDRRRLPPRRRTAIRRIRVATTLSSDAASPLVQVPLLVLVRINRPGLLELA